MCEKVERGAREEREGKGKRRADEEQVRDLGGARAPSLPPRRTAPALSERGHAQASTEMIAYQLITALEQELRLQLLMTRLVWTLASRLSA